MNVARALIEKHGGTRAFARKFGFAPSTVQKWKRRDAFPVERILELETTIGVSRSVLFPDLFRAQPAEQVS